MTVRCRLCGGSGKNKTSIVMHVNNHICPRCGGYGTVPSDDGNPPTVTKQDSTYIDNNNGGAERHGDSR